MEKRKHPAKHKEHGLEEGEGSPLPEKERFEIAYHILREAAQTVLRPSELEMNSGSRVALRHLREAIQRALEMADVVAADLEHADEIQPNAKCEKCGKECYGFPPFNAICLSCNTVTT